MKVDLIIDRARVNLCPICNRVSIDTKTVVHQEQSIKICKKHKHYDDELGG